MAEREGLFEALPVFPVVLPDDELRLLAELSSGPGQLEIDETQHAPARRLEKRGLVKISRQKSDPVAHWPTWYAEKLPAASLTEVLP